MGKFDRIIIVSDIDGTFLGKGGRLVPENLEALEYFKREGGSFTVATGRAHYLVPPSIPQIASIVNVPMIANNGAYMYDFGKGKIVCEEFLPEPDISWIVEAARRHSPDVLVRISCAGNYILETDHSHIHTWPHLWAEKTQLIPYEEIPHGNWHKIVWIGEPEALSALRPVVDAELADSCVTMLSCPTILEIQSVKGTKGAMLPRLKSILGKEDAVIWAIGDYENDLLMLQMADRRATPANGIDLLKALPGIVEVCDHDRGAIAGLIRYIEDELDAVREA